jgi:hypothetical protein
MRLGVIRRTGRRTVVGAPIWKMRLVGLACLAFAGGMVVLAVVASPLSRQIFFVLGALPFAFAAFLGFAIWRGRTTLLIAVTDEGLELPIGFLRWDEIERVDFTLDGLGIWTYDPFVLARRGNHWWLWVMALLAQIQRIPTISFTDFTAPVEDLYSAMIQRNPALIRAEESYGTGSTSTSPEETHYIFDESVITRERPASGGGSRRGTRTMT